ncbi:MAG: tRNA (N(6)-L-threonylcarbamoyladenosine(37)-C(2))-methylthiotransferase MtaB [Anaerolineae bacterium]|nr:tRNA (N(6)-L-threonylcarbamoyladenosine(37)-C(2))-methylthiotransferase MtaB [Anaerolineae bacterium]MBL8104612.1 tRNA (N(6)-L-threonylcarbamoyladenosine(37)-C(2))-methylthiotransferase MtaB [Anaerolineales bacterium]MCC7189594.1 tRNA (N(6)-L-threonylcarbamoyladenosine(37)-C(2))-methylthiotransferase MtaB [Anaerolineales bacterium]
MKIYLDTIGCRLNQAEIEHMAHGFRSAGHEIVASAELAEMAVVNTCAVTNDAVSVSRGKIRQIARAGVTDIVATGCWTTLQPERALELTNVTRVISNDRKDHLVADVLDLQPETFDLRPDPSTSSGQAFDLEPLTRIPLPGLHRRTRAFIKVQDGCNNQCTFCITTVARGEARSRTVADVIQDIQFALDGGAKEIVLTGVHLGSWGYEFESHLAELIKAILHHTDVPRLRLSSLEPWDLNADFFSLWDSSTSLRASSRLMPHLHLPLQAGSDSTLKRMRRNTTTNSFRELIQSARETIPDVAITTDIIAGFPGETDEEFAHTLDFVNEMNFAGGHVFTYSPRPGTGAAKMKGQIQSEVRKKRNHILHDALEESAKSYREKFIGQTMFVLWESTSEMGERGWLMEGFTENYLRAQAFAESPRWNEIDRVALTDCESNQVRGEILNEEMIHDRTTH